MSWLNNPKFNIDEAQQRGLDVYEVLFKDWGLTAASAICADRWPPSPNPGIPVSLAGIAIGPRSTVDRAWVTYNLQKNAVLGIDNSDLQNLTSRIRQVSLDAPLLFTQPAASPSSGVANAVGGGLWYVELLTMVQKGSLFIWPQGDAPKGVAPSPDAEQSEIYVPQQATTVYSQYLDINGNENDLGPAGISSVTGLEGWVGPLLHLYLYLKAPLISPPTKRAPLKVSTQFLTAASSGQDNCIGQFAVFGRRSARLMVMADQQCDFRVAAIRSARCVPGAAPSIVQEEPVDVATAIPANTPTILTPCAGDNLLADWLLVYCNPAAGSPNVTITFSAYD